ncbi:MAG: hypothetical protein C5B52_08795 [Bacteroidetes bacterium]|nr:MAG: hypothetical protein C5B52_08795 [Bacteroidota bacterium]
MKLTEITGVTSGSRALDAYIKTQQKKDKTVRPVSNTERTRDSKEKQKDKDDPKGQHIDTYA